jgi:hypothetical protein
MQMLLVNAKPALLLTSPEFLCFFPKLLTKYLNFYSGILLRKVCVCHDGTTEVFAIKKGVFWVPASKFVMCHKNHSVEFCEVYQVHLVQYTP